MNVQPQLKVTSHVGRDLLASAASFKSEAAVVWEYVVNSLQYVDPGGPREFRSQLRLDAKALRYRTMVAGCHQRTSLISSVCMEKISNVLLAEPAAENLALGNRRPLELPTSCVSIPSAMESETLYL